MVVAGESVLTHRNIGSSLAETDRGGRMEIRPLGNTGIDVSRLCFGTGTSGWAGASNQTRLGMDAFVELLLYGYGKGILFWDLADQYGSHANAAKALKQVDRRSVVLTTKTTASSKSEAEADIDRFLRELGTDYLDIVLMHCLTSADWSKSKRGIMEALTAAKAAGLTNPGSRWSWPALTTAVTTWTARRRLSSQSSSAWLTMAKASTG